MNIYCNVRKRMYKMNLPILPLCFYLLFLLVQASFAETQTPRATAPHPASSQQMQWWRDAKFGMFIHWGVCSITGVELSWGRKAPRPYDINGDKVHGSDPEYDTLYKKFNPEKFNAKEWVQIAQDAGMKYLVITCKHHDGFSMYPTKLSEYSIANSPFKRDPIKELADACHAAGLKFGVYYSTRDWYHPEYLVGDNKKYNDFYEGQVRELLTNYGTVDILWFDHVAGNWRDYRFEQLFKMIYSLQPDILINDRAARFFRPTTDQPTPEMLTYVNGDFSTPEQTIGRMDTKRAWESCMCLVGGQWSYMPNGKMDSFKECIQNLTSCVTGDGNMLLDVGPMPTGEIEARQIARLKEVGDWLKKYSTAIYSTRGGPFTNGKWGGSTYRGNKIWLHVFEWNGDALSLQPLKGTIQSFKVLTGGEAKLVQTDKGLNITIPKAQQDPVDTIIELTLDKPVTDNPT